jgi:hypothetical protein
MGVDLKQLEITFRERPELVLPLATFAMKRLITQVQKESQKTGDWVLARTKIMDLYGIKGPMREIIQNAIGSYFQKIAYIVVHRRKRGNLPPKDTTRPPLDTSEKRRRRKRVRLEEAGQEAWSFHQHPAPKKGRS